MPQITKCVVGMFGAGGVWVAQVVVRLALTVAQSSCRAFGTGGARGSLKGGGICSALAEFWLLKW